MNAIVNETAPKKATESLYRPSIAITLPLEGAMQPAHVSELVAAVAEKIKTNYRQEKAAHIIDKLRHAFTKVNHASDKRGVVIFVSPVYETVIQPDIPLEESVMVDEPFEIRDLVHAMHPGDRYLLLVQSGKSFRVFLGDEGTLVRLRVAIPDHIAAYRNDIAEKIEYFSDATDRKEIMLDKFIQHIDKELDSILNKYHLPVFVLGTERMNGHFKKFTHHGKSIVSYVHGSYDEATPHELINAIGPHLSELKDRSSQEIKDRIESALNANKFAFGIDEVWRNAMEKKGRMLLVEKNFFYPHVPGEGGELLTASPDANPSLVRDAVDIIISKVIENGGEVRFADPDLLNDFGQIGLILYY